MNGILLVDKPKGLTSAAVVAQARKMFRVKKIGHGGTLDPMATGLLPLALGEGTKLLPFLLEGDKEYLAEVTLGATTDTDDAEGKILSTSSTEHLSPEMVQDALLLQKGRILQKPPRYSALKRKGRPLYELARAGEEFEVEAREVEIKSLTILSVDIPKVTFQVLCSKGTYIRSMARDLGEALGVGGHLSALRRLKAGPFSIEGAGPLSPNLRLISCAEALSFLPTGYADEARAKDVRQGKTLRPGDLGLSAGFTGVFRVLDPRKELLAVAEATHEGQIRWLRVFLL